MKIDADFLTSLFENVSTQQGRAALDEDKAKEALDKARATYQQALGGLAVLAAVMERLNLPEPPALAPETKPEAKPEGAAE